MELTFELLFVNMSYNMKKLGLSLFMYINMMRRHYYVLQGKPYSCRTSSFGVMTLNVLGSNTSLVVTLTCIVCYTSLGTRSSANLRSTVGPSTLML